MRTLFLSLIIMSSLSVRADTIDHYINIYDGIPKMEMKADPQAQAWARSARNVLSVTSETIAETLLQANELAANQGKPLFCLPNTVQLNGATMNEIIIKTYRDNLNQQNDKDKLTVSQVAWIGVTRSYPCGQQQRTSSPFQALSNTKQTMQYVDAENPNN